VAKWNDNKNRIIYDSYDDFVSVQKKRMKIYKDFDPNGAPHILFDLTRLYKYINKNSFVLDAGCRDGWAMARMKYDGYVGIKGVDVVQESVEFCNNNGFDVTAQDCENLNFDRGCFDAVFCRHTLEHIRSPLNAINEFVRITKKNGYIFIVIPIESLAVKRDIKYGHSYVFERSSDFLNLIKDMPITVVEKHVDEKTLSGQASTFVMKVI